MRGLKQRIKRMRYYDDKIRKYVEKGEYENAIHKSMSTDLNSKNSYNMGLLYLRLERYDEAVLYFIIAIRLDSWLAIAYYMYAVVMQKTGHYIEASELYDYCLHTFRDHSVIEYTQLGLDLILEKQDVLINKAVCCYQIGLKYSALQLMEDAKKLKIEIMNLNVQLYKSPTHFISSKLFYTKRNNTIKSDLFCGRTSKLICGNRNSLELFSASPT